MDSTSSGYDPMTGILQHGNDNSGFIKSGISLLDQLSNCEQLQEYAAPQSWVMCSVLLMLNMLPQSRYTTMDSIQTCIYL
jgi:hypothetical protein